MGENTIEYKEVLKWAVFAYKQVLQQAGKLCVDIGGLIGIGDCLRKHAYDNGISKEEYDEWFK